MKLALAAIATIALAYAGVCAFVFAIQRSLIYYPQPSSLGDRDTTVTLPVADAHVVASLRPKPGAKAVVYFGGNGEDVTGSVAGLMEAFPHHALYLLHYRGYGGSAGTPSEAAIVGDALALFDEARREHANVTAVGRSLGSGVAVRVASARPVARLVLVTPYDSVQGIAAARFAFFPVKWLLRDKFESWKYAPSVTAPTLLVAAEHDEVIPRASTELLLTRFKPGVATLKVVASTGHNTISDHVDYAGLLRGSAPPP